MVSAKGITWDCSPEWQLEGRNGNGMGPRPWAMVLPCGVYLGESWGWAVLGSEDREWSVPAEWGCTGEQKGSGGWRHSR